MSECSICIESFNKTTRKSCFCPSCGYQVCRTCVQRYILTLDTHIVSCMNCKKIWTSDTLDLMVTKQFRNTEWKEHRETVLLEHEKSLLPATQPEVQRIKTIRHHREVYTSLMEKRAAMLHELDREILEISRTIHRLETGEGAEQAFLKEKRAFTIHCPRPLCRGFVQNTDWTCGTCNHYVCSKCHEYIGESKNIEHTCKEEDIETAKMIRKETRPCPGCSTPIYKISGCNQMWCTQCHTTFSWKTGEVITGNVHNPHYYEWMQRNGNIAAPRNPGDIPCGGLLDIFQLRTFLSKFPKDLSLIPPDPLKKSVYGRAFHISHRQPIPKELEDVYAIHRICTHIERDELPLYRVNYHTNNLDLRVKYLMQEIQEQDFKILLQQREKKNEKKKDIYQVLEMYLFAMVDMFQNLVARSEDQKSYRVEDLAAWVHEVMELQRFANNQLQTVSHRYGCVVPVILREEIKTLRY